MDAGGLLVGILRPRGIAVLLDHRLVVLEGAHLVAVALEQLGAAHVGHRHLRVLRVALDEPVEGIDGLRPLAGLGLGPRHLVEHAGAEVLRQILHLDGGIGLGRRHRVRHREQSLRLQQQGPVDERVGGAARVLLPLHVVVDEADEVRILVLVQALQAAVTGLLALRLALEEVLEDAVGLDGVGEPPETLERVARHQEHLRAHLVGELEHALVIGVDHALVVLGLVAGLDQGHLGDGFPGVGTGEGEDLVEQGVGLVLVAEVGMDAAGPHERLAAHDRVAGGCGEVLEEGQGFLPAAEVEGDAGEREAGRFLEGVGVRGRDQFLEEGRGVRLAARRLEATCGAEGGVGLELGIGGLGAGDVEIRQGGAEIPPVVGQGGRTVGRGIDHLALLVLVDDQGVGVLGVVGAAELAQALGRLVEHLAHRGVVRVGPEELLVARQGGGEIAARRQQVGEGEQVVGRVGPEELPPRRRRGGGFLDRAGRRHRHGCGGFGHRPRRGHLRGHRHRHDQDQG